MFLQARNQEGQVGLIPENYIQVSEQSNGVSVDAIDANVDQETPAASGTPNNPGSQLSGSAERPSSMGRSGESVSRTSGTSRGSAYSATDYEVQQAVMGNVQTPTGGHCL